MPVFHAHPVIGPLGDESGLVEGLEAMNCHYGATKITDHHSAGTPLDPRDMNADPTLL